MWLGMGAWQGPHQLPGHCTPPQQWPEPKPSSCTEATLRVRTQPFLCKNSPFCTEAVVPVRTQLYGSRRRALHVRCKAIRPIPIRVVSVGRSRSSELQALVKEFATKIRRYCPFEDLQVRSNPKNSSDVRVQVESEAERVLKVLHPDDWVVLLDERGKDMSSEDFAALVESCAGQSSKALVLCIGGPYGHGPQMRERSNSTVRLSKMVLNHDIALLVLLEQLYRAWTIIREEKYHH